MQQVGFKNDAELNDGVEQEVLKQLERIGTNTEEKIGELHKKFESFKEEMEKKDSDPLIDEKVAKLEQDILTREKALQDEAAKAAAELKAANERVDLLETAMQRPGGSNGDDSKELAEKQAVADQFVKSHIGFDDNSGDKVKNFDIEKHRISVEDYDNYCKAFERQLRRGSDPRQVSPEETKFLSVGIGPDGGYTVPIEIGTRIVQYLYENDPIRELSSSVTISTDIYELPAEDWDVEAGYGWVGETSSRDETATPNMQKLTIAVHEKYAAPRVTQKLLDDSVVDIPGWLAGKVSDKFMRVDNAAFVTGDGVEMPRGFLDYTNGTSFGQVEQIAVGAALTTDAYYDVQYGMIEQYIMRGTWVLNRATVRDTLKLKDGDGNYIFQPGLAAGAPGTILGRPYRMSLTMPATAAAAISIAYADWAEAYLVVDRQGIRVLRDPFTAKPFIIFYTTARTGGAVVNGQAIKLGVQS